jgi:hypothetical protein
MPDALRDFSILLITRYDKLISDKDRRRVLQRVRLETEGQFAATFPISLVQALKAGDDYEKWDASGAGPFVTHLVDMIDKLTKVAARTDQPLYNIANGTAIPEPVRATIMPRRVQRLRDAAQTDADDIDDPVRASL